MERHAGGSSGGRGHRRRRGEAVKVGIKFDQPGMGLKEGSTYTGFDVDVANYVAKELGYNDSDIQFVEAPSPQRETLISRPARSSYIVGTYSITDERKQKVSFAGPYFIAGQDLLVRVGRHVDHRPGLPDRQEALLGQGLHLRRQRQGQVPGRAACRSTTPTRKCVEALNAKVVDALTTDNTILAGYAAQPAIQGQAQGRRQDVLRRRTTASA